MYTLYCHIFPNGKKYIGITKNDVKKRWGNGNGYKSCTLMNRAIEKYGWNSVKHEIIKTGMSKDEAEKMETEYIMALKTDDPEFGYNILPGGDVSNNHATKEMRKKLGNGSRGRKRSDEEKRKISGGVREAFDRPESNGHFGMRASAETRDKMSKSQKESWKDAERRNRASERMFARMSDPEYRCKILSNLKEYHRKQGEWNMPQSAKEKISASNKGRWVGEKSPCSKPVAIVREDGTIVKEFSNAGEAERLGYGDRSNISRCCRTGKGTVRGNKFKFIRRPH